MKVLTLSGTWVHWQLLCQVLVTFHPPTTLDNSTEQRHALPAALDAFRDACVIANGTQADPGARQIDASMQVRVTRRAPVSLAAVAGQGPQASRPSGSLPAKRCHFSIARRDWFLAHQRLIDVDTVALVMTPERSIDIDTRAEADRAGRLWLD